MRYLRFNLAVVILVLCIIATVSARGLTGEELKMGWTIYEAEDGELVDLKAVQAVRGYSGRGYVTGFTNNTGTVIFPIVVDREGLFEVEIGYRAPHGDKYTVLLVNGEVLGDVYLPNTNAFAKAAAGRVLLDEALNTIALEKGWGWYEIDYLALRPSEPLRVPQVSVSPINPNITPEAQALLEFLAANFGKRIIAGQQEYDGRLMRDISYIEKVTGKEPALLGLDLMDYSPSRVERGAVSRTVEAALEWHERGGIVALTWHWNAPTGLEVNNREWWSGFYTEATSFDLEKALSSPDSEEYQLLLRDIDAIAVQLQRLQDAGVPILWRPLHEAEGGWFWWGAKGPGPAIELWKLLYHRLTDQHQIHNLIWVWNSISPEWYPGDDYVDIVSCDVYTQPHSYGPYAAEFESLFELGKRPKIVALAENGGVPDPDMAELYGALWSWFMTWDGEILRNWNSSEQLKKVYNHPLVITLDELNL